MSVSKKNEAYFKKLNFLSAPQIKVPPPGPQAQALLERQKKVDSNALVYPSQIPLAPEKGLGATVRDADQNIFIDFSGGVGVLNVGHSNPKVVEAIKAQADQLTHALDFPAPPGSVFRKNWSNWPREICGGIAGYFSAVPLGPMRWKPR